MIVLPALILFKYFFFPKKTVNDMVIENLLDLKNIFKRTIFNNLKVGYFVAKTTNPWTYIYVHERQ